MQDSEAAGQGAEQNNAQSRDGETPADQGFLYPKDVKITPEGVAYTVKEGAEEGLIYLFFGVFDWLFGAF